jgi:hypothetical protein
MVVKQRSLNELRQEKEFGYKHSDNQKKKINCDEVGFGRIRRTSNK